MSWLNDAWESVKQTAADVSGDFFDNFRRVSAQQAQQAQQQPGGPQYGNWLDQQIALFKDSLGVAAAETFRGTETGQQFISEVKRQEIEATLRQWAPLVGVGVALFALFRS